ncbi:MAG: TerC family protein [Pseudomonadota bacterium]
MIELLYDPAVWASLVTLTVMEIVLGIDNIVFITVITSKLPPEQAERARKIGLALALVFRIALLLVLSWIIGLKAELFTLFGQAFSWRDIILIGGGLFLLYKGTAEIHEEIEGSEHDQAGNMVGKAFSAVIFQILLIDMVFSVDSIITAIGMAEHVEVMIAAVIIAIGVMFVASNGVADFIRRHPTTKMLALSFLLLIGVSLVADGLGFHIPRGYIYFAMAFSTLVELVNIAVRRRRPDAG